MNKRLKSLILSLQTRHGRKKSSLCLCEGERACRELTERRPELVEYALCAEDFDHSAFPFDFIKMPNSELSRFSSTVSSQGIILVAKKPDTKTEIENFQESPFILILDGVADPGNFGTILRTSKAVSLPELWFTVGSVDPFNDKVIRAALGSQFDLKIREFDNLSEALAKAASLGHRKVFRTDPHEGDSCFEVKGLFDKSVLVFGGEAAGASIAPDSSSVKIPMPGNFESLNVAQAATIILFEYVRRNF